MKSGIPAPNRLEKALSFLAPKAAVTRYRARAALASAGSLFGGGYGTVPRRSASTMGRLGNWIVRKISPQEQTRQRTVAGLRSHDLVANDPTATGAITTLTIDSVGSGLKPQSRPKTDILGITPDLAAQVARQAEFWWEVWRKEADASGRRTFDDIQHTNLYWMLAKGDYLNLVTNLQEPGRYFSLALQVLDPDRLQTPSDMTLAPRLVDGVKLNAFGGPVGYWIANPPDDLGYLPSFPTSQHFMQMPARVAHRWACLHGFLSREPEAVRGESILTPMVKYLRHLEDYLDYELIGAIMAAAFAVWIEDASQPMGGLNQFRAANPDNPEERFQEVEPGQIFYGGPGQKPHILESKRPNSGADTFLKTILRTISHATGVPYIVLMKDYEKTSFSSARAAVNEAFRVFQHYRKYMTDHFCQPVWQMFFEEAVLRGYIQIPGGLDAFYANLPAWTACQWIGPPKLQVDPKKEMEAYQIALSQLITTRTRVCAETTGADWEDDSDQLAREEEIIREKKLKSQVVTLPPDPDGDEPEDGEEEDVAQAA